MPIVAITRAVPLRNEVSLTIPGAEVKMAPALPQMSRAELLGFVRGCAVAVTMFHDRVDGAFLESAGPQLRGVCNFAVGTDNIDVAACRARGVVVCNTPDAVTEGTANLAMGLLLAVARRIVEGDRFVRTGRFETEGNTFPTGWCGLHLTGQTLAVVGAGRIGKAVALRAQAFGMRTVYTARTRHLDFELAPLAARRVTLDEALATADVLTLHTPLTAETRHLIGAPQLARMKPTAVLINTARGPIVDEAALADALARGRLAGAGLDVFEHEPKVHPALLALPHAVLTPHVGSAERFWREEMTGIVAANAAAILKGVPPPNPVP